ncbi:MAG: 23S rRNA (pseudouridine(1915)-N(3))-methyltransferase RlmH [Candidatus Poseidoniaceae archaeon]
MGRITVHIHGPAKERAYGEMVKIYGDRLKSRGINLLFHKSKKSVDAYFTEINKSGLLFLLDESGVEHTSTEFSNLVREWTVSDKDVNLAIGPVDGWGEYKRTADLIALSKMTFPHELAAVMLVEQVYRATEIIKGTNYHRV